MKKKAPVFIYIVGVYIHIYPEMWPEMWTTINITIAKKGRRGFWILGFKQEAAIGSFSGLRLIIFL